MSSRDREKYRPMAASSSALSQRSRIIRLATCYATADIVRPQPVEG
jgi:hypothetical protein